MYLSTQISDVKVCVSKCFGVWLPYLYRDRTIGVEPIYDAGWSCALGVGRWHHACQGHGAALVHVLFRWPHNAGCHKQNTLMNFDRTYKIKNFPQQFLIKETATCRYVYMCLTCMNTSLLSFSKVIIKSSLGGQKKLWNTMSLGPSFNFTFVWSRYFFFAWKIKFRKWSPVN